MHAPLNLRITPAQVRKIRSGHPIQIAHSSIAHPQGATFTKLHPETYKKLAKAHTARKGARVHLTEAELEGTGLMDVVRKIGAFISKHKAIIKPIASAVLDVGATAYPAFAAPRAQIRQLTGVGVAPKRKAPKRKAPKCMAGRGVIPAGYAGF
jgi:hypothetical protein